MPGKTVIVVPCYNEALRLDLQAFRRFAAQHRDIRFLMVNDGSTDSTATVLEELVNSLPGSFEAISLERNSGKAEAVRRGMLYAMASGAELVGFLDADLATPLSEVLSLRELMNAEHSREVAVGIRMPLLGRRIRRNSLRAWLGRRFAQVASWVLGTGISDTQCGAKLFRVNRRTAFAFSEPFLSRWIFDVEILARYLHCSVQDGVRDGIYEWPLNDWQEVRGSKLRPKDFVAAFGQLATIYMRYFLSQQWRLKAQSWDWTAVEAPATDVVRRRAA